MTLNGWHRGERLIHEKLGHGDNYAIMSLYHSISGDLPEQHATFYTTRLPFLPIVTLDASGRPWGSILAGHDGNLGFVQNPHYSILSIRAKLWPGDPLSSNVVGYKDDNSMLVAGIGVEYPTRRRNKFAGKVTKLERNGDDIRLELVVDEALGNCPKYITIREFVPHPSTSPTILFQKLNLEPHERLPDEVISFILELDTVFLGTTYAAPGDEALRYPSHLGMNQRGGRKGFIRVSPSDGRTVVLPDFSGNRFMTSLGNIEATPLASLTFISFTNGSVLYLTGLAANLIGAAAQHLMPLHSQNAVTTIYITGFTLVDDALPVRQRPGFTPKPSPYNPPVRFLAEEPGTVVRMDDATALLTKISMHTETLATFTWVPSTRLAITPGQAAILDFTPLLGAQKYQHMAAERPTSVNDDRIRTWTVSSTSTTNEAHSFSLTMREKPGGVVTGALFNIARKLQEVRPALLEDARALSLNVGLVGVTGDFVLPQLPSVKFLWLAGGIGVTPFLAMLRGLEPTTPYDIRLILSTREPETLIPLIKEALQPRRSTKDTIIIDVFSHNEVPNLEVEGVVSRCHKGRVTKSALVNPGVEAANLTRDILDREVYLCGPESFESVIMDILVDFGIQKEKVKREGFTY
ncbi:hypothetical protein H0H92_000160 [Tricholoma furcatifolium]|nr:hypothetical protein H0H92_000160 [Tricholoma furcatifolium]